MNDIWTHFWVLWRRAAWPPEVAWPDVNLCLWAFTEETLRTLYRTSSSGEHVLSYIGIFYKGEKETGVPWQCSAVLSHFDVLSWKIICSYVQNKFILPLVCLFSSLLSTHIVLYTLCRDNKENLILKNLLLNTKILVVFFLIRKLICSYSF